MGQWYIFNGLYGLTIGKLGLWYVATPMSEIIHHRQLWFMKLGMPLEMG